MSPPAPSLLLSVLRRVFDGVARIYFREIEIAGDVPAADTGGRLFAANHVNGLIDPVLVITQTRCTISPIAKSTLFDMPGLKWLLRAARAVPIVRRSDVPDKAAEDNDAVFAKIGAHLATSGNILIFPEGTSHNEPRLLSLRTGAGRMLARARAEHGGSELTFQAVALEFDDRATFRSRALVLFGPVRRVRDVSANDVDLARVITDVIDEDLRSLLFESETWEERRLVGRVASLYANDGGGTLEELRQLGRRVTRARHLLRDAGPEVSRLEAGVTAYFAALDDAGFDDEDVATAAQRATDARGDEKERARAFRAAANVLVLPLAAVGMALYYVPYQLPRLVTRKLDATPDVASTYKLGVGLVAFPAWCALLVTVAVLRFDGAAAWAAAATAVLSPLAALPWLDVLDRAPSRAHWFAPPEERRERLNQLVAQRRALVAALELARGQVERDASTPAA